MLKKGAHNAKGSPELFKVPSGFHRSNNLKFFNLVKDNNVVRSSVKVGKYYVVAAWENVEDDKPMSLLTYRLLKAEGINKMPIT